MYVCVSGRERERQTDRQTETKNYKYSRETDSQRQKCETKRVSDPEIDKIRKRGACVCERVR